MKRYIKWFVLGGLVLFAGVAKADYNTRDHVTHTENASTGLVTDVNGNLKVVDPDRDRDFSGFQTLFTSVVLNAGTTFQPNTPKYIGQYSRAVLFLTWGAPAADSDSVRIAVRVWGKTSLNSGNLYLWTPQSTMALYDTCVTNGQVDADSTGAGRCLQPISFWVGRARTSLYSTAATTTTVKGELSNLYDGTFTTPAGKSVRIRKIPGWAYRNAGSNGAMLDLSSESGNAIPFPFILVEVINATKGVNLTSVTCDVWPRVN